MSSEPTTLDRARHAAIVPHLTTTPEPNTGGTAGRVRCPRCGQLAALPGWAHDGDLTECRGLLLRVTCDGIGCRIETL